jgi:catechol 2,3-dioxygenase-like lactoylglutathione lyase family enzyme
MVQISPMVRTAVFVSDIEKSIVFYNTVLGLKDVYAEGALTHRAGAELLGVKADTPIRYHILRSQNVNKGMVGLFEVKEPNPSSIKRDKTRYNVGEACMVFYCDNLDEVVTELSKINYKPLCPPIFLEVDVKTGFLKSQQRGQREMTFRDPDGVLLNLIERDATRED